VAPGPNSFPVNLPVAPPLPDDFRMVYLNVNGLDGFKFAELLMTMALEAVDCMVLIWALGGSIGPPSNTGRILLPSSRAPSGHPAI